MGHLSYFHSRTFGFVHKFSISGSDSFSCIEVQEITDLSLIESFPYNQGGVFLPILNIGLPDIVNTPLTPDNKNLITEGLNSFTTETATNFEAPENVKPCPEPVMTLIGNSMVSSFN